MPQRETLGLINVRLWLRARNLNNRFGLTWHAGSATLPKSHFQHITFDTIAAGIALYRHNSPPFLTQRVRRDGKNKSKLREIVYKYWNFSRHMVDSKR